MSLNPWQINLYRHNGFMRLPGQIPDRDLNEMKEAVWKNINGKLEPLGKGEDGSIVRVSNVLEREPVFWEVATSRLVLDPLTDLLGPNIEMLRHRHNHVTLVNKQSVRGVYFHRDCLTWTRNIVTIIFYLEESTVVKGCTKVIPGSHLLPWVRNATSYEPGSEMAEWDVLGQEVLVEMPAGGMILIDSQILHSQGKNQTDETRMSMTVGYCAADELATVVEPERWLIQGERPRQGNTYARMARPAGR